MAAQVATYRLIFVSFSEEISQTASPRNAIEPLEARHRSLATEQHQHLEKPGTARAAGHRHARRMDERARLNAPLGCRSTHRRFHMWLIEGCRRCAGAVTSAATCDASSGAARCLSIASCSSSTVSARNGRASSTKSVSRFARGRSRSSSRATESRTRREALARPRRRTALPRAPARRQAYARCTGRSSSRASPCRTPRSRR